MLERRAKVAELYPAWTYAEIGAELGWSASIIWQDVKALGRTGSRRPGTRQKHPDPQPRRCAGCPVVFTPPSWAPEQRFHDIPCARANQTTERVRDRARDLRTDQHRRAAAEIAKLNAAGFLTSRQLAAERKVTESAVSQWITRGLLSAERRIIEGEPHQIVVRSEFERFNAEEWPRIVDRMGPGWPKNWGPDRCHAWEGRKAPSVAAERGKTVGRRPELSSEERARIRELLGQGWSQQRIANKLGISRDQVKREAARLRKLGETPLPSR